MKQRKTEDLRKRQILEAAGKCIALHGYHRTTIDEIAKEAGLSKGALYWYFESKDEVMVTLCKEMCDEHLEVLKQVAERDISLRELAFKAGDRIFDLLIYESDDYKIFFELWALADRNEPVRKALVEMEKVWYKTISNLLNSGIERGEILQGIKVREISITVQSIFDGIVVRYSLNKGLDVKKIWHTAISTVFDGIAGKAGTKGALCSGWL